MRRSASSDSDSTTYVSGCSGLDSSSVSSVNNIIIVDNEEKQRKTRPILGIFRSSRSISHPIERLTHWFSPQFTRHMLFSSIRLINVLVLSLARFSSVVPFCSSSGLALVVRNDFLLCLLHYCQERSLGEEYEKKTLPLFAVCLSD